MIWLVFLFLLKVTTRGEAHLELNAFRRKHDCALVISGDSLEVRTWFLLNYTCLYAYVQEVKHQCLFPILAHAFTLSLEILLFFSECQLGHTCSRWTNISAPLVSRFVAELIGMQL